MGSAVYTQNIHTYDPHRFYVGVQVLPSFQGQGIGSTLVNLVQRQVQEHDPKELRAFVREDWASGLYMLESRGFRIHTRMAESHLDVAAFDTTPYAEMENELQRVGIDIKTLRDLESDPDTGGLPDLIGFLPPMSDSGYEIGWIDFSIDPLPGLPTGTQISNRCYSNFDSIYPCDTTIDNCEYWSPAPKERPWLNTVDAAPPESYVLNLPDTVFLPVFAVDWTGHDDTLGSGLRSYTVYYAEDDTANLQVWIDDTTETSAIFDLGSLGHTYYFYTVASDNVGHVETKPDSFDTRTLIYYEYICGDVNNSGVEPADIADLVYLIDYMFQGGPPPTFPEAADVADCNGILDMSDLIYLIDFMFIGGPEPCAECGKRLAAKTSFGKHKGSCNLMPRPMAKDRHSFVISGDFDTEVAGFQQEYSYDRSEVAVDSVVRHADNHAVELYWHADDGRLSLGMIDIYGKHQIKKGKSQLATIYYHTLGSEVDSLGGLTHVFTKAAERGAMLLQMTVNTGKAEPNLPKTFALHQNYPNPFNSQTIIKYDLPKASNVEITIYNILGQRVNSLVTGEQPAGFHQVTWDGDNVQGKPVTSGVYFYRIKTEAFTQSKKMVLLK